eukprot:scaffold49733_cov27-Tisochrysis_lutea.AAC.3
MSSRRQRYDCENIYFLSRGFLSLSLLLPPALLGESKTSRNRKENVGAPFFPSEETSAIRGEERRWVPTIE